MVKENKKKTNRVKNSILYLGPGTVENHWKFLTREGKWSKQYFRRIIGQYGWMSQSKE
jgi:hypothetical protein